MTRSPSRGFTLIEVMVALVVVIVASIGALAGFGAAMKQARSSQYSIAVNRLIDARTERIINAKKTTLTGSCFAQSGVPAATLASEAFAQTPYPWTTEANPLNGDLGEGSYFSIDARGEVSQWTGMSPTNPGCSAGPSGAFCVESYVSCGLANEDPSLGGAALTGGAYNWTATTAKAAKLYTVWVRVWKLGDSTWQPVVHQQVFAQ